MQHARRSGGPVAAAQDCDTYVPVIRVPIRRRSASYYFEINRVRGVKIVFSAQVQRQSARYPVEIP